MVAAFARTASSIAWEGSLQVVVDQLAQEVLAVSSADTCTIGLGSRVGDSWELIGACGAPQFYRDRMQEAMAMGAPLPAYRAYRTRAKIIVDVPELMASDRRFAPLVGIAREAGWTTLIAIPLMVRGESVGVLTAFYSHGKEPSRSDVTFLEAMADHGALAVRTARLLNEAKDKAILEERNRLARDLHDAVSQLLFSMGLRTRALQLAVERPSPDRTAAILPGLKEMQSIIESAVDEMRSLIFQLRPVDLRGNDLASALQRHVEAVQEREAGVYLEMIVSGDLPTLTPDIEEQVYRIVQEAVGNSVNHAQATRIEVRLGAGRRAGVPCLLTEVVDDGIGFDTEYDRPGHLGLRNMRARAAEMNGELAITSSSAGTNIRLEVPIAGTARETIR